MKLSPSSLRSVFFHKDYTSGNVLMEASVFTLGRQIKRRASSFPQSQVMLLQIPHYVSQVFPQASRILSLYPATLSFSILSASHLFIKLKGNRNIK